MRVDSLCQLKIKPASSNVMRGHTLINFFLPGFETWRLVFDDWH